MTSFRNSPSRIPVESPVDAVDQLSYCAECVTFSGSVCRLRVERAGRMLRIWPSRRRYQKTVTTTTCSEKTGIGGWVEGS